MEHVELLVDGERLEPNVSAGIYARTGIYVRAKQPDGKWISADLCQLSKESLLAWLRSRGGNNPWAEDTVGILLGHGHLHEHRNYLLFVHIAKPWSKLRLLASLI